MDLRRHEIPTHLDVEDRLVLGLTIRQILYLLIGGGLGYSVWEAFRHLPFVVELVTSCLPPLLALVIALVAPAGRSLEVWFFAVARFLAHPRVYVWRPELVGEAARDEFALPATMPVGNSPPGGGV